MNVQKIFCPGKVRFIRLDDAIACGICNEGLFVFDQRSPLVCVGGMVRALLKTARKLYGLPGNCHTVQLNQLHDLCSLLQKAFPLICNACLTTSVLSLQWG